MKTIKYADVSGIVKIDEDFNSDYYSSEIDVILERGFNIDYPIIIDEDGFILDGNHRFTAFQSENRLDECFFCVVTFDKWTSEISNQIDLDMSERFNKDSEYFYSVIKKIAE